MPDAKCEEKNKNFKYTLAIDMDLIGLAVYAGEKSCLTCLSCSEARQLAETLTAICEAIETPKMGDRYLYAIAKGDDDIIDLTVFKDGRGRTINLKKEFAMLLAKELIESAQ